jgi:hypothetical protein
MGGMTDYSGSSVKARLFNEAKLSCPEKGLVMVPLTSTGQDSGPATYASAEVQFRCQQPEILRSSE